MPSARRRVATAAAAAAVIVVVVQIHFNDLLGTPNPVVPPTLGLGDDSQMDTRQRSGASMTSISGYSSV